VSRSIPLNLSASVKLNGSGNGTAQLGPGFPGEIWSPAVVSVSVSTNVSEAQCKIYAGIVAVPATFIDGTLSGSTGDSTDRISGQVFYPGQFIIAVWSGGDVGAIATMNIQGSRQVP
jgi:hypothetical protein